MTERRGRRGAGETRAVLIDACIDLVRSEGLTSVSVQRVVGAARISPQGFYKHFGNVDELLNVAVAGVMDEQVKLQMDAQLAQLYDSGDRQLASESQRRELIDSMLTLLLSEPRFAELYLRYRGDPTMFGGAIAKIHAQVRDGNIAYYWGIAQRMGAIAGDYPRVAIFTESALSLYYQAGEMLLSKRYAHELVVDTTSNALSALLAQLIAELAPPR